MIVSSGSSKSGRDAGAGRQPKPKVAVSFSLNDGPPESAGAVDEAEALPAHDVQLRGLGMLERHARITNRGRGELELAPLSSDAQVRPAPPPPWRPSLPRASS